MILYVEKWPLEENKEKKQGCQIQSSFSIMDYDRYSLEELCVEERELSNEEWILTSNYTLFTVQQDKKSPTFDYVL